VPIGGRELAGADLPIPGEVVSPRTKPAHVYDQDQSSLPRAGCRG
jgi:hypothetical protein